MIGRILIALFVAVVILAECLLAYLLIPSADQVAAVAKEKIAQEEKVQQEKADPAALEGQEESAVEVELGRFDITLYQPTENASLRIGFLLVGTVNRADKAEFEQLFANNHHRFRDRVLYEIRNSEVTDLTEPGLGLIKRRILEKSNALFGKPLLKSVVFSEFAFQEQ